MWRSSRRRRTRTASSASSAAASHGRTSAAGRPSSASFLSNRRGVRLAAGPRSRDTVRKGAKSRLRPPGQRAPANDPARLINQSNAAVSERRFARYRRGKLFHDDPAERGPDAAKGTTMRGRQARRGSRRQVKGCDTLTAAVRSSRENGRETDWADSLSGWSTKTGRRLSRERSMLPCRTGGPAIRFTLAREKCCAWLLFVTTTRISRRDWSLKTCPARPLAIEPPS